MTGDALSDTLAGPITMSAAQLVQIAQFVRGTRIRAFARGNRQHTCSILVHRVCRTAAEAMQLAATALQDHATSGTLTLFLDDGGSLSCPEACLASCAPERYGTHLLLTFEFICPAWVPGGDPLPETESIVMNGTLTLLSEVDSVAASGLAMPRTPARILLQIEKPDSTAPNIWPTLRSGTLSSDGFEADLSAPTDRAGYKLHWFAL